MAICANVEKLTNEEISEANSIKMEIEMEIKRRW